jgi:hypothetical protein
VLRGFTLYYYNKKEEQDDIAGAEGEVSLENAVVSGHDDADSKPVRARAVCACVCGWVGGLVGLHSSRLCVAISNRYFIFADHKEKDDKEAKRGSNSSLVRLLFMFHISYCRRRFDTTAFTYPYMPTSACGDDARLNVAVPVCFPDV